MTSNVNQFSADNLPLVGQTVIDEDGNIGTVIEVDDIHNIRVGYKAGGMGLYCLEPKCLDEYSPLFLSYSTPLKGTGVEKK